MIVNSLIVQLQNSFHVSTAEIDEQSVHQIIIIWIAVITSHNAMADILMEEISMYMEENCEAEILEEAREIDEQEMLAESVIWHDRFDLKETESHVETRPLRTDYQSGVIS